MTRRPSRSFLPDPSTLQLFRAALLSDCDVVAESLRQWSATASFEDLDPVVSPVLPLLDRNLARCGVAAPTAELLRGTQRSAWARNALMIDSGLRALDALRSTGIPALLGGTAASIAAVSAEIDARPLHTFEVLVREEDMARAVAGLEQSGWTSSSSLDASALQFADAARLLRNQLPVDLRWKPVPDLFADEWLRELWSDVRPATLDGRPVAIASPEMRIVLAIRRSIAEAPDSAAVSWIPEVFFAAQAGEVDVVRVIRAASGRPSRIEEVLLCFELLREQFAVALSDPMIEALRDAAAPVARKPRSKAAKLRARGGSQRKARRLERRSERKLQKQLGRAGKPRQVNGWRRAMRRLAMLMAIATRDPKQARARLRLLGIYLITRLANRVSGKVHAAR